MSNATTVGQLFVVATPIGNLGDITYRAVETLKTVDLIAAEDTRTSRKLLQHYGISTPMVALHEHNEEKAAAQLIRRLQEGENIALISDAGTPLVSDPGYRLLQQLSQAQIRITPIPGASSILAAISAAGLPTDHFRFAGFPARSGKARRHTLQIIAESVETQIMLESPHRLLATLKDLAKCCGEDREIVVARELTKLHEEFIRGKASEVIEHFETHPPRGEIVLLVGPAAESGSDEISDEQIMSLLQTPAMQALPPSARARSVAKDLGLTKARVYALITAGDT